MESKQLRNIIEGALLAAGEPLSLARLNTLFEEDAAPAKEELLAALEQIGADCEDRGFELKEVGSGWRFQVRAETAPWVNRLWEEKPQKYSRAVLETLALVAYRQPITRGDIEEIRGVAVSSHIIKSLSERDWIKVVGHRDVPGRPALYATTRQFLDYFNLKSLDELPSLGDIRDLEEINNLLDLGDAASDQPSDEPQGEEMDNSDPHAVTDSQDIPDEPGQPEQPEIPEQPEKPEVPDEPAPEPEITPEPDNPEIPRQPVTPEAPESPEIPEVGPEDTDPTKTVDSEEPHSA
ncbi:SMC-Scp complex subunit ScpB [Marinimicrobium sp. ABcell2]|uniref:SMC-Scp complex subunit ScpB n=1 Tax=Marinimicrobium sp. ABcell2 TaxID=3069751 RepID=UPI0027B5574B|nr:SMC-Scp complex subunit ScpB [Marinimicrobium sp. ABcell2]MDQ2075558.1 SMC-Scp complex subunit ScpB [Marinimicrobium sp. ABcell2]